MKNVCPPWSTFAHTMGLAYPHLRTTALGR